jgi:hypothetical protein
LATRPLLVGTGQVPVRHTKKTNPALTTQHQQIKKLFR